VLVLVVVALIGYILLSRIKKTKKN
jgi:hypothetical protein